MAGSFSISTDALTCAAGITGGGACDLGIALASLRQELDAHHHPWGDDEQGRSFQGRHQPDAGQVEGSIDHLVRAIESTVAALHAMALGYDVAETASAIR
ncbi:MAG: hypothetical protein JWN67_303 [Actinomycetia bacterium]|nr:hypothetical protein [Actinomycetes bacterium]